VAAGDPGRVDPDGVEVRGHAVTLGVQGYEPDHFWLALPVHVVSFT
jgi:hypothetical protein